MVRTDSILSALAREDYSKNVLLDALRLTGNEQMELFRYARERRKNHFPDNKAQARSVIETSNVCRQRCRYCAIGGNKQVRDYTLNAEQVVLLSEYLYNRGRRVILLQSGENINTVFLEDTVRAIHTIKKKHSDLRIILCMGDLSEEQYTALYNAGATDYILKFETSNEKLFSHCKPNDSLEHRLECIQTLSKIGYRVGSGNIVGLPRQTVEDLVDDLQLVHKLPLAMNSATIFVPAENTPFAEESPGDPNMTLNMMALMRIMNPHRFMPTTSSLEKMIPDGQYLGLMAGANTVTIHDGTPEELQQYFPIYSAKRIRPQIEHFRDILARAEMRADNIL